MRLDRMLANMGYGSRKEVRHIIRSKHVTVNGKISNNQGEHINPEKDIVQVNGETVHYRENIYIMLNKPSGYISATEDGRHQTVIDLISNDYLHFKLFPVGRLDLDTVGLLLLTNDGQLAHQLTSPNRGVEKTYYAKVRGVVDETDVEKFAKGVILDDGYETKPGNLEVITSDQTSEIQLTITEGKYHQVKRMFASVGKEVIYLKRIRMGDLHLDESLREGEYRELNEKELSYCLSLKQ